MDRAERIAIISAVFGCDEAAAAGLEPLLRSQRAERGRTLAHQGDRCENCHFVIAGSAGLRALGSEGQLTQIATVEPGEVFGAYPAAADFPVEVVAREAVELLVVGSAQLAALARQSSAIAAGLATLFARQLAGTLGRLAARVTLSARGRVYGELLAAMADDGRIAPPPVVSALAIMAQTTRETASRAISELERRGVLAREREAWRVVAPRLLEELVY